MKKPQLFLLHFAGGNCYSYQFMTPLLKGFEVVSLELPGRGKRMNEPLLKNFSLAGRDIFYQVRSRLTGAPFIIYGHSLGAYLALRVAGLLQNASKPPAYLIVSGNAGPGEHTDTADLHLLPQDEFLEELKKLGGMPQEFLEHNDLLAFFEPVLRADFQLSGRHGLEDEPPVNIPLFAMMGSEEEKNDRLANWGRFTTKAFDNTILEGNHFFIYKHPERIVNIINDCITRIHVEP